MRRSARGDEHPKTQRGGEPPPFPPLAGFWVLDQVEAGHRSSSVGGRAEAGHRSSSAWGRGRGGSPVIVCVGKGPVRNACTVKCC
eukprot:5512852-Alexandrium_andersonii.AAC.1